MNVMSGGCMKGYIKCMICSLLILTGLLSGCALKLYDNRSVNYFSTSESSVYSPVTKTTTVETVSPPPIIKSSPKNDFTCPVFTLPRLPEKPLPVFRDITDDDINSRQLVNDLLDLISKHNEVYDELIKILTDKHNDYINRYNKLQ